MPKPTAVLVADVHYSQKTLELADAAVRMAINKANELQVPLIIAGDLHDTKANLRAECVNAMIKTFKLAKEKPYVIIGNHDRINEKAPEHSLGFLRPFSYIVEVPMSVPNLGIILLPYFHDRAEAITCIAGLPKTSTIIMHQGIEGSNMGTYIQDKSAVKPEDVGGRRVISGHYHARQTINLPDGGQWDYIGNPFSLGFGEANDPEKSYQILMDDGSLTFVPTGLPKHRVLEYRDILQPIKPYVREDDILWVKIYGASAYLTSLTKPYVARSLSLTQPFRLDLIPNEATSDTQTRHKPTQTGPEILDSLIESLTNTDQESKNRLKQLWKDL